jgi:hypothetical protein
MCYMLRQNTHSAERSVKPRPSRRQCQIHVDSPFISRTRRGVPGKSKRWSARNTRADPDGLRENKTMMQPHPLISTRWFSHARCKPVRTTNARDLITENPNQKGLCSC